MKLLAAFIFTLYCTQAQASNYYPTNSKEKINKLENQALRDELFKILVKKHISLGASKDDKLVENCGDQRKGRCYGHRTLSYNAARKILFGVIHLEEDSSGHYIKDVYCQKKFTSVETRLGPNIIPDHSKINCEHTWPQSKFNPLFSKGQQKTDLHHLYPADSKANSVRGNYEFSFVDGKAQRGCESSYLGRQQKGRNTFFEPPNSHKGNVARSIFYFAVRYKMPISDIQEDALRQWHEQDPIDEEEMERNETIHLVQGNRNPFIDFPEIVDQINDF
jgi:deoxyribonuclease I